MGVTHRATVKLQKAWICFLTALLMPAFAATQESQPLSTPADSLEDSAVRQALVLDVQGPIGPATAEYLVDSLQKAASGNVELVILRMDTPGGLDASTRDIVKAILNSAVPVATFVTPAGARAASAGMYILLASHVAAMSPATNVGAATPVSIIGGEPGDGHREPAGKNGDAGAEETGTENNKPSGTMERKTVNDAVAYARGLAERYGRNADSRRIPLTC